MSTSRADTSGATDLTEPVLTGLERSVAGGCHVLKVAAEIRGRRRWAGYRFALETWFIIEAASALQVRGTVFLKDGRPEIGFDQASDVAR